MPPKKKPRKEKKEKEEVIIWSDIAEPEALDPLLDLDNVLASVNRFPLLTLNLQQKGTLTVAKRLPEVVVWHISTPMQYALGIAGVRRFPPEVAGMPGISGVIYTIPENSPEHFFKYWPTRGFSMDEAFAYAFDAKNELIAKRQYTLLDGSKAKLVIPQEATSVLVLADAVIALHHFRVIGTPSTLDVRRSYSAPVEGYVRQAGSSKRYDEQAPLDIFTLEQRLVRIMQPPNLSRKKDYIERRFIKFGGTDDLAKNLAEIRKGLSDVDLEALALRAAPGIPFSGGLFVLPKAGRQFIFNTRNMRFGLKIYSFDEHLKVLPPSTYRNYAYIGVSKIPIPIEAKFVLEIVPADIPEGFAIDRITISDPWGFFHEEKEDDDEM